MSLIPSNQEASARENRFLRETIRINEAISPQTAVGCAELARIAERELTAYLQTVSELFGDTCARLAAEEWLRQFEIAEFPLETTRRDCRLVTVTAAARLAHAGEGTPESDD